MGSTDRHPGHFDAVAWPEVVQRLADGVYEPLDLAYPCLKVDTSTGLVPDVAAVLAFVR